MEEEILRLQNIRKDFGSTEVLRGLDLSVRRGEFLTLLGPSGCGKTTTLRIIAGLEQPDGGRVLLSGRDVTDLPPEKRDVNTVFQNYALFPHMTVEANVGYSLKLRKIPKEEIRRRVEEALSLVQLEDLKERMPSELSGGQKQRVAIARSIISRPRVLLLDEPLGALDLQLRRKMQLELKQLQKQLGMTFIYITHDQEEALTMSDRVLILRDGLVQQIGTPLEVYERPATSYVAGFVGEANLLKGRVTASDGKVLTFSLGGGRGQALTLGHSFTPGDPVTVALRGEDLKLCREGKNLLSGEIQSQSFAGGLLRIRLRLPDGTVLTASRQGMDPSLKEGSPVGLSWDPSRAVPVDLEDRP